MNSEIFEGLGDKANVNMSTATVSSAFSFHKPISIYDSIRKREYSFFRKSSQVLSDENIFGREKHNYIYDTPRSLLPKSDYKTVKVREEKNPTKPKNHHSMSHAKPSKCVKNGVHFCQNPEKIKR